MWFERLMGFREERPEQVRANIEVDGEKLISKMNGCEWQYGRLDIPTLAELRESIRSANIRTGQLRLSEIVGDVQSLHADPKNTGAIFQVASQFNLLEMVSPSILPERGVGIYENDHTQGPACAIACGAGTVYRNYFVDVNGQTGQSAHNQIDCLRDMGDALGNSDGQLWKMQNGYALASADGLAQISDQLSSLSESELDRLRGLLRIGIQSNTQVTLQDASHKVTQAFCSALPVAYSMHNADLWESFAKLVLEASFEATMCASVLNAAKTGNDKVFLTLLGGGAFGNRQEWILAAIKRALDTFARTPLDVSIVSYGSSNSLVQKLCREFRAVE